MTETNKTLNDDEFDFSTPHISKKQICSIISNVINTNTNINNINNLSLYQRAFVHRSIQKYLPDDHTKVLNYYKESNEVLELVGDGILSAVVIDYLYHKYPDKDQGELTKYRTRIVRGKTLTILAEKIGMKGHILMSNHVKQMNGKENKRLLEDTLEAFIGAMYLDTCFEYTKYFIICLIEKYIKEKDIKTDDNYKDILLRYTQSVNLEKPVYRLIREEGKPNEKIFTIAVELSGKRRGKGKSSKKKEAEQKAAKYACCELNLIH